MRKGLSPIISAILILLIAISVTLLAIIWLPRLTSRIFSLLGFNESYIRSRGCLSIENVNGLFGLFTIKNCGKVALSDFSFFIDSSFISKLNIGTLNPSQSIDFYSMPITGGRHSLYITADYAESPPYLVDVPYWECIGGEPLLISDWYVSKNMSCICSYNTVIPVTNVYVIGNGSLSLYNCVLFLSGSSGTSTLNVRDNGFFGFIKSRLDKTPSNGGSVIFEDNSTEYLLNSSIPFSDTVSPVIRDEAKVTVINSYLRYPQISSNISHRLSVSNVNGCSFSWCPSGSGSPITNYFKAENSNFTVNLTNVSFVYIAFSISDNSNTTIKNSYFEPFYINSDYPHNLTIRSWGCPTYFDNYFKAQGSNLEFDGTNFHANTRFYANGNSNNTIIDSCFSEFHIDGGHNSTNKFINFYSGGNWYLNGMNFTMNFTNFTKVNDQQISIGPSGYSLSKSIWNFSNATFYNAMQWDFNGVDVTFFGNMTYVGNPFVGSFSNSNVTRYYPTIIKDSNNNPFPMNQPAVINITNYLNQSVWLGNVSGGTGTYYIDNPNIVFNASNYNPGNFSMRVSQVCENITNITLLSNTSLEFTINRSYNYDGTSFNTQVGTGLSFDNLNFWVATAGGNVYKYDKAGGYTGFSFNSGLNILRDVSSNGIYLWLLNYNSTEKRVYRYLPSGTSDNWNFDISAVLEPYAVDFDGESFWILGNTSVYKYNITGGYTGFSFALNRLPGVYYGDIVSSSGNIWVLTENYSSSKGRGVFRYKSNGTYDNWYFDIAPTTTTGRGLAFNGTYFWVMNSAGTVFRYGFNRKCLDFMKNCDEFITLLPYAINKNNTRYCLLYNLYAPSQTAITFASNVKNSTLDCQWYNIGGNGAASTVGIFLTGANNNTINNCNINSFDNGIKISSSSNNVITNVNSYSNGIGIVVTSSSNNAVTNCSINGNINNDYYLASLGINNNFINTNFTDYRTIYFYDTTSWFNYKNATESLSKLGKTAVGGNEFSQSSHSKTASRFQLTQAAHISNITVYMWGDDSLTKALIYGDNNGVPNNLIGSSSEITVGQSFDWYNFTFGVPVYLSPGYYWLTIHHKWNARFKYDIGTTNQAAIQDFNTDNYDDGSSNPFGTTNYADSEISIYATYTADNIWLKTNVSAQAQLTRKLINWNDKLMQWKDTFSNISGSITARYNVTGLVPGAPYSVYNNSFELVNSPIKTDMSGILSFSINLPANEEHEIKVVEICDYYLYNSSLPYVITQNNSYYCLIMNVTGSSASTAISFSPSVQNSTLDCVGNSMNGKYTGQTFGIFSNGYNSTVKNCNLRAWDTAIYYNYSNYGLIYNTKVNSDTWDGATLILKESNNTRIDNVNVTASSGAYYYGIDIEQSNNVQINNTISNVSQNAVYIGSSVNLQVSNSILLGRYAAPVEIWPPIWFGSQYCNHNFVNVVGANNKPILFYGNVPATIRNWYNNFSEIVLCNADNSVIDNVTMIDNYGIRAWDSAKSNFTNIKIYNFSYAVNPLFFRFDGDNMLANITVDNTSSDAISISECDRNNLSNVSVRNSKGCGIGILYNADYNSVKGGSSSNNTYDYCLSEIWKSPSVYYSNNFTDTNFTGYRTIYFTSEKTSFIYNNETAGNIWIKTKVSAPTVITRKLLNWNQNNMTWTDNSSSTAISIYNISGLLANTAYAIYDNSVFSQLSISDSIGQISFTVYLPANQEHNIKVQTSLAPPLWLTNSTNNNVAGGLTTFRLKWTDDLGLSGYIFSTNNSGTWVNDSFSRFNSNTSNSKFYDGFENGDFSAWTGTNQESPASITPSFDRSIQGNYSAKSVSHYGGGGRQAYVYKTFAAMSEVYARMFIYIASDSGTGEVDLFALYDSNDWRGMSIGINGLSRSLIRTVYIGDTNQSSTTISTGVWHSLEIYYKAANPSLTKTYLDGVEVTDLAHIGTDTSWFTISRLRAGNFENYRGDIITYVDDIVVSNSYIESATTGWSNVTKALNLTDGINVQWCVYANDTGNNWNYSSCLNPFSLNTTPSNVLNLSFNEGSGTIARDSSVYGNDGTFYGETFNDGTLGSTSGTDVNDPSRINVNNGYFSSNALDFDGSNDYVEVNDNGNFDLSDSFTLMAWIYPESWGQNSYGRIIDKNSTTAFNFFISNDTANIQNLRTTIGGTSYNSDNYSLSLKTWQHVAVTFSASADQIRFYIDGVNVKNRTRTTSAPINSEELYIGNYKQLNRAFNGTIDEVRIWNSTLNQTEIQVEMSSSIPVSRPVAAWSFEESSGQYANDTHIWVKGTYGSALSFDGANDYVRIPDSSSFNINGELTVSAWVYPLTNQSTGGSNQIVQRLNWGTKQGFFLREGYGPTQYHAPQFYVGNGTYWNSVSSGSINPNGWHYITGTVKSNDKIRIYIDGSLKDESNYLGIINQSTGNIFIGWESGTKAFNGTIDEVRIWSRALNSTEINEEMTKG